MGAVPKRRISRTRRDKRRSHHALTTAHLIKCPHCGEMRRSHHVCLSCGMYRDHQVLPADEG